MHNDNPKAPNEVLKLQWMKLEIVNVSCSETEDKFMYSVKETHMTVGPS